MSHLNNVSLCRTFGNEFVSLFKVCALLMNDTLQIKLLLACLELRKIPSFHVFRKRCRKVCTVMKLFHFFLKYEKSAHSNEFVPFFSLKITEIAKWRSI